MTRSARVAHAVTALREARAAESPLSEPASFTFRVSEDNGGRYRWTLVSAGETLVQSAGFPSYEEAEQAARIVRDHASSASVDERVSEAVPTARR